MNDSQPWKVLRDFTDEMSRISVRVTAQENHRIRFSVKIGRLVDQPDSNVQAFIPFIPVYLDIDQGKVTRRDQIEQTIERLMLEAFDFIHVTAQDREDSILEQRISREQRDANRGKPPARVTGKTAREKAKQRSA